MAGLTVPTAAPRNITATLASFASSIDPAILPGPTLHAAARLLLDTLGCMLGGVNTDIGGITQAWVAGPQALGTLGNAPRAVVVGTPLRTSTLLAGYANGRTAAALDADETYPSDRQTSHLAAASVAGALAICESRMASKSDLLAAVIAGYEVGARVSDSVVPAVSDAKKGLTAGWGPGSLLGATAAAGRAAKLGAGPMAHAIGIAGTHVDPPALQWADSHPAPMVKSADAGWHALTAIAAVEMAELGMTGYNAILDGDRGLWKALGYAQSDENAATDRLGERWIVRDVAFKRWPCQFWMQPALTALWDILESERLEDVDIDRIVLSTNDKSLAPKFCDAEPIGEVDRAFSFPHAAAMLVLRVPTGPGWCDNELAQTAAVRRLRSLVRVDRHPDAGRLSEWVAEHQIRRLPARATVSARGRTFVTESHLGLGSPWSEWTRLSDEVLVAKFREMIGTRRRSDATVDLQARGERVVTWVFDAPHSAPIYELAELLTA